MGRVTPLYLVAILTCVLGICSLVIAAIPILIAAAIASIPFFIGVVALLIAEETFKKAEDAEKRNRRS